MAATFVRMAWSYIRLTRFSSTVSTTLTTTIDVIGMNTRVRPLWMLMSPGSLPNQVSSHGA